MVTNIDPDRCRAVLFDLDGVLTDTTTVHSAAWKHLFDDYFASRTPAPGEDLRPFSEIDYARHIDGKPRIDGVADFLRSRHIELPLGSPDDDVDQDTMSNLSRREDRYFADILAARDAEPLAGAFELIKTLRQSGVRTAAVSASRDSAAVLEHAGLSELFDACVDGMLVDELGLAGKPDPAMFLEAVRLLGAAPADSAVIGAGRRGMESARQGGFSRIIGVDRANDPDRLLLAGADSVVASLSEVTAVPRPSGGEQQRLSAVPAAGTRWHEITERLTDPAVLLDFDGTLAPIHDDPAAVWLSGNTQRLLRQLAEVLPVAVVSGRDLRDLRRRVGVDDLWYVGSHGFELSGPGGEPVTHAAGNAALPELDEAESTLPIELAGFRGAVTDRKPFGLAVHYRNVASDEVGQVLSTVREVAARMPGLKVTHGRLVTELLPDLDWNKGRAVGWLLNLMREAGGIDHVPVYAGDDFTDEDALRVVYEHGVGIVVRNPEHGDRHTWARYAVEEPRALSDVLARIASWSRTGTSHPG